MLSKKATMRAAFAGSSVLARWAPPLFKDGLDPETVDRRCTSTLLPAEHAGRISARGAARHPDGVLAMARQSGRERRGDQDEKRQPYQIMFAPSPHRRKPLIIVPPVIAAERQSAPTGLVVASVLHRSKRMGATSGCWGAAAGIVQRIDLTLRAIIRHLRTAQ